MGIFGKECFMDANCRLRPSVIYGFTFIARKTSVPIPFSFSLAGIILHEEFLSLVISHYEVHFMYEAEQCGTAHIPQFWDQQIPQHKKVVTVILETVIFELIFFPFQQTVVVSLYFCILLSNLIFLQSFGQLQLLQAVRQALVISL